MLIQKYHGIFPQKTQNLILQESRNGESTVETHTDCGVENYRLRLLDQPTDNVSYSKNTLKLIVSVKNSVFLETQCSSSWVQPPSWGAFTHNALRNGTYLAILAQWFILSSHVWKKHRVTKAEERSKASRRQENHIPPPTHTHPVTTTHWFTRWKPQGRVNHNLESIPENQALIFRFQMIQ